MKILIAIRCCHSRQDYANAQRKTWLKNSPVDYKIFYGDGHHELLDDEVQLSVPDDYDHVVTKAQKMFEWAVEHDYDFIAKADDDVYAFPHRFLASDYTKWDFVGGESFGIDEHRRLFKYWNDRIAPGGFYCLSKKAMQTLISVKGPGDGEERWIAEVLSKQGIKVHLDDRTGCYGNLKPDSYEFINASLPKESEVIALYEFSPEEMVVEHDQWLNGTRKFPVDSKGRF